MNERIASGTLKVPLDTEEGRQLQKLFESGARIVGASGFDLLAQMRPNMMALSIGHALRTLDERFNPVVCRSQRRMPSRGLRPEDIKAAR